MVLDPELHSPWWKRDFLLITSSVHNCQGPTKASEMGNLFQFPILLRLRWAFALSPIIGGRKDFTLILQKHHMAQLTIEQSFWNVQLWLPSDGFPLFYYLGFYFSFPLLWNDLTGSSETTLSLSSQWQDQQVFYFLINYSEWVCCSAHLRPFIKIPTLLWQTFAALSSRNCLWSYQDQHR